MRGTSKRESPKNEQRCRWEPGCMFRPVQEGAVGKGGSDQTWGAQPCVRPVGDTVGVLGGSESTEHTFPLPSSVFSLSFNPLFSTPFPIGSFFSSSLPLVLHDPVPSFLPLAPFYFFSPLLLPNPASLP